MLKEVSFSNSRGLKLSGVLHEPEKATKKPWVILNHGMLSTKSSRKHIALAEKLCNSGLFVFRYDFSGQGESEGEESVITYSNGIDDLKSAVNLLKGFGATKFVLFGSSMGAGISILTAPELAENIVAMVLMASIVKTGMIWEAMNDQERNEWKSEGVFDFHGRPVSFEIISDGRLYSIEESYCKFSRPVLFVHGTKDALINYNLIDQMESKSPHNHEIFKVDGADHRFSEEKYRLQAIEKMTNWINQQVNLN